MMHGPLLIRTVGVIELVRLQAAFRVRHLSHPFQAASKCVTALLFGARLTLA